MNKKALYESIMKDVATVVKKHLNEMTPEIYSVTADARKIELIKYLRNETNLSFKKANETIDVFLDDIYHVIETTNITTFEQFKKFCLTTKRLTYFDRYRDYIYIRNLLKKYPELVKTLYTIIMLRQHSKQIHYTESQMLNSKIIDFDVNKNQWKIKVKVYAFNKHIEIINIYDRNIYKLFWKAAVLMSCEEY